MPQPSDLEKNELLSQILSSPEFHDSVRYQELLRYLAEKSSKVTSLKEAEIAHEVFGKDSKFDPSTDPLIRSYISNLRKKLEHYYLTTDHKFEYRIEIPKGQYLVKYTHVAKSIVPIIPRSYQSIVYPVVIAVLVVLFLAREFVFRSAPVTAAGIAPVNPIWTEFVENNGQPTLIVVGDYLVLSEKGKMDGRTFLRVPQINSESELRDQAKLQPNLYGNYVISDVTYIGAGASMGIWDIMKAIGGAPKQMSIKLSSQLKWDDFDNNNIVYVGTFKTLDKLDTLFSRTNVQYCLNPNGLKIRNTQNDSVLAFSLNWHGGNYQKDYSIILKLKGSKNNSIVFLTGFSELGVMESVKSSVDPALISRISKFSQERISQDPFLFELVCETEGVRYTAFRSEVKYFSLLPNTAKPAK
jgi:hypothetical protein